MASYKGLVISTKPGTHSLQKPANLKNSLTCVGLLEDWDGEASYFSYCRKPSLVLFLNITMIGDFSLTEVCFFGRCLIFHVPRACKESMGPFLATLFGFCCK